MHFYQVWWPHLNGLQLADSEFYRPGSIDLVLGADVYGAIILEGLIKGSLKSPIAQRTVFGWIISGPMGPQWNPESALTAHVRIEENLYSLLQRFWELEEVPSSNDRKLVLHKSSLFQKFQLLQGLLRDKALKVIAALEASDANYAIAWELLKKRYENTRLIVNTHLKGLFELAPVAKSNHANLRNLVDEVRTHICSLQALKLPVQHWDAVIIYLITNKFDSVMREEWEKEISPKQTDQLPELEEMMAFLEKRCVMLEMTDKGKSQTESTSIGKKTDKKVMLAATAMTCPHCAGSHPIFKCEKFLKLFPQQRYTEIKQKNLCNNYVKTGHVNQKCWASSCKKCNLKHNTLLHKEFQVELSKKQYVTLGDSFDSAQLPLRKWRANDPTILESLTEARGEDELLIDNQESELLIDNQDFETSME
ncbi:hypothetical protein ALC60_00846 [Trachymyrmex zeteki]|uniref:Uncharacterized protein n=1 Tax=Mycetomoellerius zeteki TaxID=64791 RepID=A0A151XI74_9HYME|nr:hypothetical protein ALC60_00846 [Trachymyrmex zeteki]